MKKSIVLALVLLVTLGVAAYAQEPGTQPYVDENVDPGDHEAVSEGGRFAPAYVFSVGTRQTDVGLFTTLLEVDSYLWKGHTYRVGTFTGTKLAGPGFTLSVFEGRFKGDPAIINLGLFYLAEYSSLDVGHVSVGVTVRLKL